MPSYDRARAIMAERGRPDVAYTSLMEALRLNPTNTFARARLADVRKALGMHTPKMKPAQFLLDSYPSAALHMLAQVRPGPEGQPGS